MKTGTGVANFGGYVNSSRAFPERPTVVSPTHGVLVPLLLTQGTPPYRVGPAASARNGLLDLEAAVLHVIFKAYY